MKAILQRVKSASVTIDGKMTSSIDKGIMLLLGISHTDSEKECDFLADKAANLRIFEDEEGKMNLSLLDTKGQMLIVSQFTLYGDCKKGRRPSFTRAAKPEVAIPLYESFISKIKELGIPTAQGEFGEDMLVSIENDGPVTIAIDTDEIMPNSKK